MRYKLIFIWEFFSYCNKPFQIQRAMHVLVLTQKLFLTTEGQQIPSALTDTQADFPKIK